MGTRLWLLSMCQSEQEVSIHSLLPAGLATGVLVSNLRTVRLVHWVNVSRVLVPAFKRFLLFFVTY